MAAPRGDRPSLVPVNLMEKICFKYIPMAGGASYGAMCINMMQPSVFKSIYGSWEVAATHGCWLKAHIGVGLYLYSRNVMKQADMYHRIAYSVFGSVIFNFGSVLLWGYSKLILPDNTAVRVLFGLSTAVALVAVGMDYIKFVDSKVGNKLE
ncbi:uncharacterized protein LOC106161154 [Lingula anatina]|uniref:Uncharacterized protein LOC106161154 n=1 Tax=Lingula anatina TaxID=7574 RepID=A0A1S3I5H9_LINAN|nr:uncharacterized protein LOC106161154 [Lingula anatina]|eukprot:XP_013393478.1 uncharacterized protein LOC106161154 [Lingula anatina]